MTGSEFADLIRSMRRIPEREDAIYGAAIAGHLVTWPCSIIQMKDGTRINVANDYFAIGTLDDFVRVPVSGPLALQLCAALNARPPTAREVDAIWHCADIRLAPRPWGPPYDETMLSVERFVEHNTRVEEQRAGRTGLIAGIKKDVCGVRKAREGDVLVEHRQAVIGVTDVLAFYGWHNLHGDPIQHDNGSHEPGYADYSHGLRFVFEPNDTEPSPPPC